MFAAVRYLHFLSEVFVRGHVPLHSLNFLRDDIEVSHRLFFDGLHLTNMRLSLKLSHTEVSAFRLRILNRTSCLNHIFKMYLGAGELFGGGAVNET